MKTFNKFFLNMGLFSVLAMLLIIPIATVALAGFTNRVQETSEVLSAQDEAPATQEQVELLNDVPPELEELIRQVEEEMYRQRYGNTSETNE